MYSPHFYEKIDTYVKKSVKNEQVVMKRQESRQGRKGKGWRKI